MKAMIYDNYGDESVLHETEVPEPRVGPGEVLVRVSRAAVNPVDWKLMSGALDQMIGAVFPVIPGWDVAGEVVATGPDTPEFATGDRVAAYNRLHLLHTGTFAEYVTVPATSAAMIPDGVSDEQAAALPLTGLTAQRSLDVLRVKDSETVLLHAASGGVGFMASQLAAAKGARVIGTASAAHAAKLRDVGVTPVEYGPGLTERLEEIAPGGVDAVADFAGGVLDVTLRMLKHTDRHVSIVEPEVEEHGGRWIWVRPDGARLADLLRRVAQGSLRVAVDRTFPLAELPEAFRVSRNGQADGKLLIQP